MILGDEDFVEKVKAYVTRGSLRDQPSYRELAMQVLQPEQIVGILQQVCGITQESLKARRSNGVERGIAAELLYKFCDITERKIGTILGGIDYSAVYLLRRRFREKMVMDTSLSKKYKKIEEVVMKSCSM